MVERLEIANTKRPSTQPGALLIIAARDKRDCTASTVPGAFRLWICVVRDVLHRPKFAVAFRAFTLAVLALVIFQRLSAIGWHEIISRLPRSIVFYCLFIFFYLAGPIVDALIYRRLWGARWDNLFPAMLRKRVFNESLLGYSGEAYLAAFARLQFPDIGAVLIDIRDANIVSAFISTAVTLTLVIFVSSLSISMDAFSSFAARPLVTIGAAIGLIILVTAGAGARCKLLRISGARLRFTLGGYLARIVLIMFLQIAVWNAALPEAPLGTLLVVLTATQTATRIPFAPSYDVLLLGAGMAVAPALGLPIDDVAGVLVASFALTQFLNLVTWVLTPGPKGSRIRTPQTARAARAGALR